jgi:general secretion pathway protein K
MNRAVLSNKGGFVLIITLWVLGFLSVLVLAIGLGARQKIVLLERLEDRSRARLAAEAGAKKALAVLVDDLENNQFLLTPQAKARRHNNPTEFFSVKLGEDAFSVSYESYDSKAGALVERYGLQDEQAKLNLNFVDLDTLARLLGDVWELNTGDARYQAAAIIDWRDFGKHEEEGFFSDDYYSNLEFPYAMKDHPFERIDELLLVKGIDKAKYDKLLPYVTIWGDGLVNINTASEKVLVALGLEVLVAQKLIKVRGGLDGVEDTADDHVYNRTFDIAAEVKALALQLASGPLEEREMRQIDALNMRNVLTTNSSIYSIRSRQVPNKGEQTAAEVLCVFNITNNKIEYWYEK